MHVEQELREEIDKWLKKLDSIVNKIKISNEKGEMFTKNITAYFKDAKYFFDKNDLVRAFECLILAWAWIEIGKELEIIEISE
jgi:hypothetical protein